MRLLRRITLDMPVAHSSAANTAASLEPLRFGTWSRHASSLNQQNCKDGYAPTRPNQKESIFQRLAGRLGLTYSRSRRWRKRQVRKVFLCAALFYSRVTVRPNVFSKKVKKPFYFWREPRRTREKRTQSDRFRLPQRKNRNKSSPVVRVLCHPQRQDSDAKSVQSKGQIDAGITRHDVKRNVWADLFRSAGQLPNSGARTPMGGEFVGISRTAECAHVCRTREEPPCSPRIGTDPPHGVLCALSLKNTSRSSGAPGPSQTSTAQFPFSEMESER
jgi:hypothetical protein